MVLPILAGQTRGAKIKSWNFLKRKLFPVPQLHKHPSRETLRALPASPGSQSISSGPEYSLGLSTFKHTQHFVYVTTSCTLSCFQWENPPHKCSQVHREQLLTQGEGGQASSDLACFPKRCKG